jgi:rhamnosyltransferase
MKTDLVKDMQVLLRTRWAEVQNVDLHDWFVYAFARSHGYKWVIDECPTMLYRQHDKNQFGANAGWLAFAQRARKVLNGWGFRQSVLIAQLVDVGDDPFVRHWSGISARGMLWLAMHAGQCRRRALHRAWFGISCVLLALKGERS